MGSLNNIIRMRTLIVSLLLLVLLLDIFAVGDEIDRTFHLFKKKKEKVKDKLKKDKDKNKPSYKPVIARTFRKENKNKDKKKPKPSNKPSYHSPAVPSYTPSYHAPSYPGYRAPVPYPISVSRHFGSSVVGPHHAWPQPPQFGPLGYRNNFPF